MMGKARFNSGRKKQGSSIKRRHHSMPSLDVSYIYWDSVVLAYINNNEL